MDREWIINGAGLRVSHKFGFGVIDAEALETRQGDESVLSYVQNSHIHNSLLKTEAPHFNNVATITLLASKLNNKLPFEHCTSSTLPPFNMTACICAKQNKMNGSHYAIFLNPIHTHISPI